LEEPRIFVEGTISAAMPTQNVESTLVQGCPQVYTRKDLLTRANLFVEGTISAAMPTRAKCGRYIGTEMPARI